MCAGPFKQERIDPPEPIEIPETPMPVVTKAKTMKVAPKSASSSTTGVSARKRTGRGSLRIPLISSGLSQGGLNFPTS